MGLLGMLFNRRIELSGEQAREPFPNSCGIDALWDCGDEKKWLSALERYRNRLSGNQAALEEKMMKRAAERVRNFSAEEFYDFLHNQYFVWKYTAKNRLATTRKQLERYVLENRLDELEQIKNCLFERDHGDIKGCLEMVTRIHGLGPAGASGLLAVLFPEEFGTVDQFVVKSLLMVNGLPENELLQKMNPEVLTVKNAELLVKILRRKAEELNKQFKTDFWTPRKLDMVLWAIRS